MRTALYMAAWVACRFNPTLKAFSDACAPPANRPSSAIIAVARKLLTILNAMLRDRQPWRQPAHA